MLSVPGPDFVEVLAKDLASRSKQARTRQRRIDLWSNQLVEKEGELSSADAGAAQVLQTEIQALKDKIERQKVSQHPCAASFILVVRQTLFANVLH